MFEQTHKLNKLLDELYNETLYEDKKLVTF
jgi:hypothetical protein